MGDKIKKWFSKGIKQFRDFGIGLYFFTVGLCVMTLNDIFTLDYWVTLLLSYILLSPAIIYIVISSLKRKKEKSIDIYREYLLQELEKKATENFTPDEEFCLKDKNTDNANAEKIVDTRRTGEKDIIAQMLDNNNEIKEYFKISKNQVKSSFWFSVIVCILGISMLGVAIYRAIVLGNLQAAIIGTISGSITEAISGTALWVHNKSALQLNHYYDALHQNEKFLFAINMADKLSDEKREEMYIEIIRKQTDMNSLNIKHLDQETNT